MEFWMFQVLPGIFAGIFFLIGIVGTFIPVIPACLVIWAGIFIHKLWAGGYSVGWEYVWLVGALVLIAHAIDWLCTYWGARRFGATWRGGLGALLGIILGPFLFTPLIGFVLGPIIGAVAGELVGGRRFKEASKAGVGTIVGGFIAFLIKMGIAIFMIAGFYNIILV